MPDREKIIAAMEWCRENPCKGCPYEQNQDEEGRCSVDDDTIVLLKEQEAIKPTWSRGKPFCGACGLRIHGGKFCSECGKAVKWE